MKERLEGMIAEINWYAEEVINKVVDSWSGWPDLNRRPPHPQCGALPGCATSRNSVHFTLELKNYNYNKLGFICVKKNYNKKFKKIVVNVNS